MAATSVAQQISLTKKVERLDLFLEVSFGVNAIHASSTCKAPEQHPAPLLLEQHESFSPQSVGFSQQLLPGLQQLCLGAAHDDDDCESSQQDFFLVHSDFVLEVWLSVAQHPLCLGAAHKESVAVVESQEDFFSLEQQDDVLGFSSVEHLSLLQHDDSLEMFLVLHGGLLDSLDELTVQQDFPLLEQLEDKMAVSFAQLALVAQVLAAALAQSDSVSASRDEQQAEEVNDSDFAGLRASLWMTGSIQSWEVTLSPHRVAAL